MSPIGRVFIVLNLVCAGGFVYFAGTHLQQQHNYKQQLTKEQEARKQEVAEKQAQIDQLTDRVNTLDRAKLAGETELASVKNALDQAQAENKRLTAQVADNSADIDKLLGIAQAGNDEAKAAFAKAEAAMQDAQKWMNEKDSAVRAKDTAEAENRELKTTIAGLNETVGQRDEAIAALETERSELNLLVSVAQENGFIAGLAAPTLTGTVAHVANNRLCTIKITDNPGNVDIADQLAKRKFSFAIYDSTGYKGEATATAYHAADNAVTCTITLPKGVIKAGDKASTKTP